jgi:hypothetical protein
VAPVSIDTRGSSMFASGTGLPWRSITKNATSPLRDGTISTAYWPMISTLPP